MSSNRKERRSKLDIYYSILNAVLDEESDEGAKPTRIQYKSNMSYDKLAKHLETLQEKDLLVKKKYFHLTEKGNKFLAEYSMVKDFVEKMEL